MLTAGSLRHPSAGSGITGSGASSLPWGLGLEWGIDFYDLTDLTVDIDFVCDLKSAG